MRKAARDGDEAEAEDGERAAKETAGSGEQWEAGDRSPTASFRRLHHRHRPRPRVISLGRSRDGRKKKGNTKKTKQNKTKQNKHHTYLEFFFFFFFLFFCTNSCCCCCCCCCYCCLLRESMMYLSIKYLADCFGNGFSPPGGPGGEYSRLGKKKKGVEARSAAKLDSHLASDSAL